jgi:hypothetical protein
MGREAEDDYFSFMMQSFEMSKTQAMIYDRHPLISALIYEPIICGTNTIVMHPKYGALAFERGKLDPVIIYCRPPRDVMLNWGEREQMAGVKEQAEKLIERYDTYMANLRSLGFEVINYDYTIPMHQENICKIVENQAITGIYPAKPEDEDFCETQRNLINGATKRFKGFMVNSYGGKMTNGSC